MKIYKIFAVLLLSLYMYSFSHMVYMGIKNAHSEHEKIIQSKDVCIETISLQKNFLFTAQKIFKIIFFAIFIPFTAIIICKLSKLSVLEKIKSVNFSPPILQELFSNGVLNTKAY